MIRVRLTSRMVDAIGDSAVLASGCAAVGLPSTDVYVDGTPLQLADLVRTYVDAAKLLDGVKGKGTIRRVAIAASERIANAIDRAERRATDPIPISITLEEQEAIRAIAEDEDAPVDEATIIRLRRRGLLAVGITARGRAVAAGTPPGDLVPIPFFTRGVRVRLAFDLDTSDPDVWQTLQAGHECVVDSAADESGRVRLITDDGPIDALAVTNAHPRIFYVVARAPA